MVDITLNTSSLRPPAPGGLSLGESENFLVAVPEHNLLPPQVLTRHARFLGFPHVLAGSALCLYLDAAREWQPAQGMRGLINRLWVWLDDAVNARFDPSTALYHAVGGVLHTTNGAPTIVVRDPVGDSMPAANGHLVARTNWRFDHHSGEPTGENDIPMPIFLLPYNLPFGAGHERLVDLLQRLDYADIHVRPIALVEPKRRRGQKEAAEDPTAAARSCRYEPRRPLPSVVSPRVSSLPLAPPTTATALLTVLAASAARQPDGSPQYVLLCVPHPAGGPPHLLALRLPASVGDALRHAVRARETTTITLTSNDVMSDIAMEWCGVSDERADVTVRRDETRPVNILEGKIIHVWGCGGLGSWIAEFAVRAGAQKVVVCDPSTVTGGLLVRQNYTEADVGKAKANGLAERLRAISDTTEVQVHTGLLPSDPLRVAAAADLIVDATVSLAITQVIDTIATDPSRRATVAQIATDSRTGTLGLAVVVTPGGDSSVGQVDAAAGATVACSSELESYRVFWSEPGAHDELTPTRGCSAPTFHGSAADMAAVAGSLLSLISLSIQADSSGVHLLALPHSGVAPTHRYIQSTAAGNAAISAA